MREEKIDFDTCSIRVKVFHPERTEKQISAKRIQGFELTLFLFLLDILSHLPLPSFHWPSWDLHWHIFVDLLDTLNSSPHIFKRFIKNPNHFFRNSFINFFFYTFFTIFYMLDTPSSILHSLYKTESMDHFGYSFHTSKLLILQKRAPFFLLGCYLFSCPVHSLPLSFLPLFHGHFSEKSALFIFDSKLIVDSYRIHMYVILEYRYCLEAFSKSFNK